jgi:thiamine biosynthesis lipoprotein
MQRPPAAAAPPDELMQRPDAAATVVELKLGVMASKAHVILVDPVPGAEGHARRRLEELERRWSRFLPDSDVSRINGAPDALILVSPDTIRLLTTMQEGWRLTGGRYDPTVLAAVVKEGYTASIDWSGRAGRMAGRPCGGVAWPSGGRAIGGRTVGDVSIDPATSAVIIPRGVGLDPGGIGKGLAADLVVTELLAAGTGGALVGVGGDLAAAGTPPTPAGWHVNVQHPLDATRVLVTLALSGGGVATSSTQTRTWVRDGRRRHHVIDPATQTCSSTDLAAATVIARAGWEAEAHATAALLCGSEHVLDYFTRCRLAGLATTIDGVTLTSPGLDDGHSIEGSAA